LNHLGVVISVEIADVSAPIGNDRVCVHAAASREIGETCGPGTFIQKPRSIPLNREPPMDPQSTVTLHTGSPMPILGLGTWQLTEDTAATVEDAFRLGYRMIDTSGDYGTQPGIGEAIKHAPVISAYRASSAMPYMVQNGAVEPLPLSRQPIDAGSQPATCWGDGFAERNLWNIGRKTDGSVDLQVQSHFPERDAARAPTSTARH